MKRVSEIPLKCRRTLKKDGMKSFVYILFALFLGVSCKETTSKETIPVLDMENSVNRAVTDQFTWNSIAKQIAYVPISNESDILMGSANPVFIGKNFFYVSDPKTRSLLRIGRKGEIENRISRRGKGPGEYATMAYVHVNEADSVVSVFDQIGGKCIAYDWNGDFVKEIWLKEKDIDVPLFVADDYAIVRGKSSSTDKICLTDKDLNVQKGFFSFDSDLSEMERMCLIWQLSVSKNQNRAVLNFANEDTVYTLSQGKMEPLCVLKKGVYKLPDEDAKKPREMKPVPYMQNFYISALPGYFLVTYMLEHTFYDEIWEAGSQQLMGRFSNKDHKFGLPIELPNGKKVRLDSRTLLVDGDTVVSCIDAGTAVEGGIEGIGEDDNPVLIVMKI